MPLFTVIGKGLVLLSVPFVVFVEDDRLYVVCLSWFSHLILWHSEHWVGSERFQWIPRLKASLKASVFLFVLVPISTSWQMTVVRIDGKGAADCRKHLLCDHL